MDTIAGYEGLTPFFGDIHNHCNVGYGHGSAEDAFKNAQLQLDFAAITPHAHWPDIPSGEARLQSTVDYHKAGFKRTEAEWERCREVVERYNQPGRFVTFLGFEWHSMQYGDHHVIYKGSQGAILRANNLKEMRQALQRQAEQGIEGYLIPHHIGYKQGFRGIDWTEFDPQFSPVVEIMSMHGASESDEAPHPFLHSMGPRDWQSTLQYGLTQGHIAGVVGSTDHHSAHPGSYGHGRLAAWSSSLTRAGIWEAIGSRRTYALTGDRIQLAFSINGRPMGSVLPADLRQQIEIAVVGGDALDEVVLVHNNAPLQVWKVPTSSRDIEGSGLNRYKIHFEVGWGKKNQDVDWEVKLQVIDGDLVAIEPRFRGPDVVARLAEELESYQFSRWERVGEAGLWFRTRTWGNPTTTTASMQGVSLEVLGKPESQIQATANGKTSRYSLAELAAGARVGYVEGVLSPAFYFHRAVPSQEYQMTVSLDRQTKQDSREWYYVRVRQKNNQYAWSSPIWIEG